MTTNSKPVLIKKFNSFLLQSQQDFSIELGGYFEPQDQSLWFHLLETPPNWLRIDSKKGMIYGTAPNISENRNYQIKLQVSNKDGFLTQTFTLRVMVDKDLDQDPVTLTNILSLKRQRQPYSHLHPYTPDQLEFLYYFYMHPEKLAKAFEKSFRKFAEQHQIKLPEKVDYRSFKDTLTKVHPNIEKDLTVRAKERLRENFALMLLEMNNEELQVLFRQGSQQQGVITIPVWNNLGAPSLHNRTSWSAIDNVLDMASTKLARRMQRTNEAENKQQESQHQKFQFEKAMQDKAQTQKQQQEQTQQEQSEQKKSLTPELRPPTKR